MYLSGVSRICLALIVRHISDNAWLYRLHLLLIPALKYLRICGGRAACFGTAKKDVQEKYESKVFQFNILGASLVVNCARQAEPLKASGMFSLYIRRPTCHPYKINGGDDMDPFPHLLTNLSPNGGIVKILRSSQRFLKETLSLIQESRPLRGDSTFSRYFGTPPHLQTVCCYFRQRKMLFPNVLSTA